MRVFHPVRWLLIALFTLIPPSSYAGVFISVGFAPPVLPVYIQPSCPEPDLIWTPGYWAYGDDGYYWVPGAWVPAPYEGALWTPPYWGWDEGVYVFHPGYWGLHVGYYGGVNYGFGYFGVGFVGGEWHEHEFAYNTAVVNVNRTVIHNTYVNETVIHNTTIVNNRISYAGGPGGIRHDPTPVERAALNEPHVAPTSFQQQHMLMARNDHENYFNANHGHPQSVVTTRPLPVEHHQPPVNALVNAGARGNLNAETGAVRGNVNGNASASANMRPFGRPPLNQPQSHPAPLYQSQHQPMQSGTPASQQRTNQQPGPVLQSHSGGPVSQIRPAPQPEYRPEPRPQVQYHPAPQPQYRPAPQPQYRSAPQPQAQYHPAPEPQYRPAQQTQYRPAPQPQYRPAPQTRPEPQFRPPPPPRQESRPAAEPRPREPHP